jgi:cysteine-rich repeat protein
LFHAFYVVRWGSIFFPVCVMSKRISLLFSFGLWSCVADINAPSGTPNDPDDPPPPPSCGDGIVDNDEQCDDANAIDDDGCKNNCTLPGCGDGVVNGVEECDDGNAINTDACKNNCEAPFCGDGLLSNGEACDDGNNTNGDGCSAACSQEQSNDTLIITSPTTGEEFERDEFDSQFQFVTSPLTFTATALDPNIVEVEYLTENDFSLGIGTAPDFLVTEPFRIDGNRTITAHGRNSAGTEIATATIQFVINPPVDEACLARLTAAGVTFNQVAPTLGIHTPIRFFSPMVGITYLPFGASNPNSNGELASCELTETLVNITPDLTSRGITVVEHIGIYNFRCIGGGDPTSGTCNPSEHAFAKGIDMHEFRTAVSGGTTFNTETDFVIDPAGSNTCTAATSNTKDALLHALACAIHNINGKFHTVLTPNFNADHRNHFHVDIKETNNFIRSLRPERPTTVFGVDVSGDEPIGH